MRNRRRKVEHRDGNRQERGPSGNVVIFVEPGRVAKSHLKHSSKVYLEGRIQTRSARPVGNDRYIDRNRKLQRSRGELVLSTREGGSGSASGGMIMAFQRLWRRRSRVRSRPQPRQPDTGLDDDVPFYMILGRCPQA